MSLDKKEFEEFLKKFDILVARVVSLEKENFNLREQINSINSPETKKITFASIVKNQKITELESVICAKAAKEIKSMEKKENNIILTGLPKAEINESTKMINDESEKNLLKEILTVLEVSETAIRRFSRFFLNIKILRANTSVRKRERGIYLKINNAYNSLYMYI